jgi:hypothetical protein
MKFSVIHYFYFYFDGLPWDAFPNSPFSLLVYLNESTARLGTSSCLKGAFHVARTTLANLKAQQFAKFGAEMSVAIALGLSDRLAIQPVVARRIPVVVEPPHLRYPNYSIHQ